MTNHEKDHGKDSHREIPDPRARIKQKIEEEERARQSSSSTVDVENAGEPEEIILEDPQDVTAAVASGEGQNDQVLRLMADFENYRRRTLKELAQERQRGRRDAVEKLLPVYDSISMGMITMPKDSPVLKGMEAVLNQLNASFEALGIKKVPTIGQVFDPNVHEAIANLPSADHAEGVIAVESRAGFSDAVGLLRPAQVVVSSGNPG